MYIYCITNKITGKQYVGKCAYRIEDSTNYYGSGVYIKASIKKHGKGNFIKEILEAVGGTDNAYLNEREIFWIKEKSSKFPNGYNLTDGGDGSKGLTEESIERIRQKNKLLVGGKNSRYGKKNSQKHNTAIRNANLGKKHSIETKEKLRQMNLGKKQSAENKEKLRQANTGRVRSKEKITQAQKNQPHAIKVDQYKKDGSFVCSYISAIEACRQTGVNNTSIANCCKGKSKSSGGYIWKFKGEV